MADVTTSQIAVGSLVVRNRYSWAYNLSFSIGPTIIEHRLWSIPEWWLFNVVNVAFCLARIGLNRRLSKPGGITLQNFQLLCAIIPIHSLCMGMVLSVGYVIFGFDSLTFIGSMALALFAHGAVTVHRANLNLVRQIGAAFLVPPGITAMCIGGATGYALGSLLLSTLVYCFRQSKVENAEYWATLHNARELRNVQRKSIAAERMQAALVANRIRQTALAAERERIAGEWHDTLLAGLSAIGWQIESAKTALAANDTREAAMAMNLARSMLSHYRTESRSVIDGLRQQNATEDELAQAIADAVEPLAQGHNAAVEVFYSGEFHAVLTADARHQLIRICQEAVANALKHANPQHVAIRIEALEAETRIEVQDDGQGFDPQQAASGHYGLEIMKERAARLAASTFAVTSVPGQGTTVALTIPHRAPVGKTGILLISADPETRALLEGACPPAVTILALARSGAEGARLQASIKPDLTLVEIMSPADIETVETICVQDPAARVLVLSNLEVTDALFRATEAGACGYLPKDASPAEFAQAIEITSRGETYFPTGGDLTSREHDVLEQLVLGRNPREIALCLGIGERTVRVHSASILAKLGAADPKQAAAIAVERGLVFG